MAWMDRFSLAGKRVVVTGGAQGIGKVVADYLAEAGAEIGIFDINKQLAKKTAEQISSRHNIKVEAIYCDVTSPESITNAFDSFSLDIGVVDAVFNNAGIVLHKEAETLTPEEWLRVIDVDVNGVFFVAQEAARRFIKNKTKGTIVNTASMSGIIVNIPQCQASYNTAKAAVIHMTKSLAVEWAKYDIRVNSISPGYIHTEMTAQVRQDWKDYWLSLIPFGRMGLPEELAGAVLYLLSDASSYTTGANIVIDGGFTTV